MNLKIRDKALIITLITVILSLIALIKIQFGSETIEKFPIEIVENLTSPIEEKIEQTESAQEEIETHQASNESAENVVDEVEPLASLEELKPEFFENNSENTSGAASDFERDFQEFKKDIDLRIEKLSNNSNKEAEVAKLNRKTTVRYYLENRTHIALPIPVYKCITGGTIAIDIEVNAEGKVISTRYNDKLSNSSNGCLIENAIDYATKALFQSSTSKIQKGRITYLFQSK